MSWKSKTGFCLFILWLHTPTALSSSRFFKFSIWLTASVSHREACIALLFPSNIPTGDATEPESTDLGHRSNLGHQLCYKWSFILTWNAWPAFHWHSCIVSIGFRIPLSVTLLLLFSRQMVPDSLWPPWTAAHQASLSFTISPELAQTHVH